MRTEEVWIAFGHALIDEQDPFEEATYGQQLIPLAGATVPTESLRDGTRARAIERTAKAMRHYEAQGQAGVLEWGWQIADRGPERVLARRARRNCHG